MAHVTHPNAPLTPTGRLALARCIVEDGWAPRRAAPPNSARKPQQGGVRAAPAGRYDGVGVGLRG
ncbi:hypothetical protein ACFFN5_04320, partial [Streptomonospora salina]